MSEPFLGEIRMIGFNFAPRGWAYCDGLLLPINQNQSLYSLLGTAYGGDGRTTFAIPDLRGRTPIHVGVNHSLGEKGGGETHALTTGEIPLHGHTAMASADDADTNGPTDAVLAKATTFAYENPTNLTPLGPASVAQAGASAGHENMQPFLALHFVIALAGLFPSRN